MFKKIIFTFLFISLTVAFFSYSYGANDDPVYTQLRVIDNGTFNEYRYKITDEFFNLRNKYEINGSIDSVSAGKILNYAKQGYNYLPDSLSNKNYYSHLKTSVEKGVKYPNNSSNYTSLVSAIENYLDKTNIQAIKGSVEAFPNKGNAPLNVTLRGNVKDPTGTKIPKYNYIWWMQENGKRKVLGNGYSLNHVFNDEGNFAIHLDVKSAHKNKGGYDDVLSFSSRAEIVIKEKIASILLKVNSQSLRNKDELKFTPDDARYGLLFDATSSSPTAGTKFVKTTWDFGNGIRKTYNGGPKIERAIYAREGEYQVSLKLQTNELKTIERKFQISVHDPIATIEVSSTEGFLGDKFRFNAQKTGNDKNLSFSWEIIDLDKDKIIFLKSGKLFTYTFKNKGKYNVKMKVTEPSGKTDIDTQIIYINSRAPVADFSHKIPFPNKPNKVFLDATKSYDPDYSDDGKLKYSWIIDGNRVKLDESNYNGSNGYFTFDSVGDHSVVLEVEDPDNISSIKKGNININSILSVEFFVFPRVTQREKTLRFVSSSPEARFFEWDFGDGVTKGGKEGNISHIYKKSGIYNVILKVRDVNDNINKFTKNVYIGDSDSPYAFMSLVDNSSMDIPFDQTACDGKGAYIVNRVNIVTFSGKESINITGETNGLTYSWKLGKDSYKNSSDFTKKFDELGCFPIKLTVKSKDNGKTDSITSYVEVKNILPTLSSLDVRVVDPTTDPVIVNVTALGAKDNDGVIQSYLWYYYTDIDSEPQDFRATKGSSTSFVLPKVTGNYYFVVVMKDNNEDRVDSEQITGSKYFMTLTGDNLNTPLVSLKVNDSTLAIGDEAIFTVNVENILGQDLTNKVQYSWDFNGDGFYDEQTTKNVVTHEYTSSGEKHAKVKAKYKGFSNTKTVTIAVSNILKPDFGYISIGNKFIFFYNGIGVADSYTWDLGDGTVINNKKYFIHQYKNSLVSHIVNLKISEGTKVKNIEKKVIKNVKNIILARKNGLLIFSSPQITKDDKIILNKQGDNAFIYLGESKKDIVNYVIDYDINYDSDLNGGNDDDEDNKKLDSYTDGGIIKVELNENRYQKIRVYIKDTTGNIVASKDITIVKKYISEKQIDINSIVFKGVSASVKFKIEKLKNYVDGLPKANKLKASMYIQKLQAEWGDNREKTNVILEFEGFIDDIKVDNADEIINILEGLLVEDQNDKSDKAITYVALKNLIPTTLVCKNNETLKEEQCYDKMIAKLDAIKNNDNIDENKVLGTEILNVIAKDKVMTNKEKIDFKAILKTFIYGGVANIPTEEKQVVEETTTGSDGALLSLIYTVFKWIAIIIFLLIGFIVLFYIYFKVTNKDKNLGFQDFIIEKTSGDKKVKKVVNNSIEDDILSDLTNEVKEFKKEDIEPKGEKINNNDTIFQEENISDSKIENIKDKTNSEDVPDWLKGNFSEEVKAEAKSELDISKETKKENIKETKEEKINNNDKIFQEDKFNKSKTEDTKNETNSKDIPDWLKGNFSEEVKEEAKTELDTSKESKKDDLKEIKKEEEKLQDDDNIPDWLKGSFSEDVQDKKVSSEEIVDKSINEGKVEKKNIKSYKDSDDNIPDWLKGSFSDEVKDETKIEEKTEIKVKPEKKEINTIVKKKKEKTDILKENNIVNKNENFKKHTTIKKVSGDFKTKQTEAKKVTRKKKEIIEKKDILNKEKVLIKKEELKRDNSSKTTKKIDVKEKSKEEKNTELWDDGMKVPDWLQSDDNK